MAKRPYYVAKGSFPFFEERFAEFKFEPGFALVQARKNIHNFHDSIAEIEKTNSILEVSTKSSQEHFVVAWILFHSLKYYLSFLHL